MWHGGTALRFDIVDFCAYDVLVLKRAGAEADHPADRIEAAQRAACGDERERPGEARDATSSAGCRRASSSTTARAFAARSTSTATSRSRISARTCSPSCARSCRSPEEDGVRMAIHPDDPPFPIFGLPRVVSSADDAAALLAAVPSPSQRADALHRLLRRRPPERPAGHGEALRLRHPFRPSAQRDEGAGRLLPRGRASRRRHRHGRGGRRAARRGAAAQGRRAGRTGKSRCGPTTAMPSSTTSARR